MLFFYSWSVCDLLIHAEKCWNKWNDPNLALAVQLLCLSSPGLPAVLAAQQAPTWTLCSLTCCSLPCWRKNLCWAMAWTWGSILCNILNSWPGGVFLLSCVNMKPCNPQLMSSPTGSWAQCVVHGLGNATWGQHMLLLPQNWVKR